MWCAQRCRRMTRRAAAGIGEAAARHTALVREGGRGSGLAVRRCGGAEALARWSTQVPTSFAAVCEWRGRSAKCKRQGAATDLPQRPKSGPVSFRGRRTGSLIAPKWDNVIALDCSRAFCGMSRSVAWGALRASRPRRSLRPPTMHATPTSCDRYSSTCSAHQGACLLGPDLSQRYSGPPGARIRMVDAATIAEPARRSTPPNVTTAGSTSFDPMGVGFNPCSSLPPPGLWSSRIGVVCADRGQGEGVSRWRRRQTMYWKRCSTSPRVSPSSRAAVPRACPARTRSLFKRSCSVSWSAQNGAIGMRRWTSSEMPNVRSAGGRRPGSGLADDTRTRLTHRRSRVQLTDGNTITLPSGPYVGGRQGNQKNRWG
ncbi:hypothetical protein SAMN04488241_11620 [Sphingomonas rubra]|uniref:Uncharacterized protein n=1 Tax=Sphingomonas rubra TaxID=634430 RepID=A0A1I5UU25_9SPHN|nr:hypothetical protein SAMN04488241_11620 [Sphingomonas rubra]